MTSKFFEPLYGDYALKCLYFRGEPAVNAPPSIEVLELCRYERTEGWVYVDQFEVAEIAANYEITTAGDATRDELIDLIAERVGACEVRA